jgi:hypothetical protein
VIGGSKYSGRGNSKTAGKSWGATAEEPKFGMELPLSIINANNQIMPMKQCY